MGSGLSPSESVNIRSIMSRYGQSQGIKLTELIKKALIIDNGVRSIFRT
jgi:hypothetical protein